MTRRRSMQHEHKEYITVQRLLEQIRGVFVDTFHNNQTVSKAIFTDASSTCWLRPITAPREIISIATGCGTT